MAKALAEMVLPAKEPAEMVLAAKVLAEMVLAAKVPTETDLPATLEMAPATAMVLPQATASTERNSAGESGAAWGAREMGIKQGW